MLKIRLSRVGKRNSPIYRLVVAEKSRAVKREYIEILGLYKPTQEEDKFQCKKDRIEFWLSKGAQPSETVNNLLCDFGVLPKSEKLKIVYGKKQKKKDIKKGDAGEEKKQEDIGKSNDLGEEKNEEVKEKSEETGQSENEENQAEEESKKELETEEAEQKADK